MFLQNLPLSGSLNPKQSKGLDVHIYEYMTNYITHNPKILNLRVKNKTQNRIVQSPALTDKESF